MAVKGKPYPKKPDPKNFSVQGLRPGPAPWQGSYATHISGMEAIEDLKMVAEAHEDHWGAGMLRLLAPADLREKFDRQRFLTQKAIELGDLAEVKNECSRMAKGWAALNRHALAIGASQRPAEQWETVLGCGTTLVVVKTSEEALRASLGGRKAVVVSLGEVAKLFEAHQDLLMAKLAFPGAEVVRVDTRKEDPLRAISTSLANLDDDIDDIGQVNLFEARPKI